MNQFFPYKNDLCSWNWNKYCYVELNQAKGIHNAIRLKLKSNSYYSLNAFFELDKCLSFNAKTLLSYTILCSDK